MVKEVSSFYYNCILILKFAKKWTNIISKHAQGNNFKKGLFYLWQSPTFMVHNNFNMCRLSYTPTIYCTAKVLGIKQFGISSGMIKTLQNLKLCILAPLQRRAYKISYHRQTFWEDIMRLTVLGWPFELIFFG